MFKAGAALIAGGFAAMLAAQSALTVAAAPQQQQHSALTIPAASSNSHQPKAPVAGAPTSLGHFYGKATSNLAHVVPAGPDHGKVMSAFARSSNPSHTNGHRGKGLAKGHAKP